MGYFRGCALESCLNFFHNSIQISPPAITTGDTQKIAGHEGVETQPDITSINGEPMTREKILGIPSYADRDITEGSIYHVLMHGKNAMGSHATLVNAEERWQISQHVLKLRRELIKD